MEALNTAYNATLLAAFMQAMNDGQTKLATDIAAEFKRRGSHNAKLCAKYTEAVLAGQPAELPNVRLPATTEASVAKNTMSEEERLNGYLRKTLNQLQHMLRFAHREDSKRLLAKAIEMKKEGYAAAPTPITTSAPVAMAPAFAMTEPPKYTPAISLDMAEIQKLAESLTV